MRHNRVSRRNARLRQSIALGQREEELRNKLRSKKSLARIAKEIEVLKYRLGY